MFPTASILLPREAALPRVRARPSAHHRLRPVLAVSLLSLPLFAGPTAGAAAQTAVRCIPAGSDGSHPVPEDRALKPSGLGNGARFRLPFVTSTARGAAATDIAAYGDAGIDVHGVD